MSGRATATLEKPMAGSSTLHLTIIPEQPKRPGARDLSGALFRLAATRPVGTGCDISQVSGDFVPLVTGHPRNTAVRSSSTGLRPP